MPGNRAKQCGVTSLTQRLRAGRILVAPGVYDPLSARIAAEAGAEAVFVSGAAVALSHLAAPDFGFADAGALVDVVARIADAVAVPVLVDGDQGFGHAGHVARLVRALGRVGAAAVQIEDQQPVKRVGALRARPLIPAGEMVGKINAALDARSDDGVLVSARTDALSGAGGIDEALDRADAYVAAGCDLLFVESVRERSQADAIAARFAGRVPLVHNLLETGGSPFADARQAEAAGFDLALFPATGIGAAAGALREVYRTLARDGGSGAVQDRLLNMNTLNDLVGASALEARLARYGDTQ